MLTPLPKPTRREQIEQLTRALFKASGSTHDALDAWANTSINDADLGDRLKPALARAQADAYERLGFCDCYECMDRDRPCSFDCDRDDEACVGCRNAIVDASELGFEIDRARGIV